MARSKNSKSARMRAAIDAARTALDTVREAFEGIDAIREEYSEWFDAMPENWQNSDRGTSVQEIGEMDTDGDSVLSEAVQALDDIESALDNL